jgi:hypothetical protein
MTPAVRTLAALFVLLPLAACGGRDFRSPNAALEHNVAAALMTGYDANGDQLLSRDEFETALQRDFATLDRNSDGFLDRLEMGEENDRRWQVSGTASTPLIDWNGDGFADFNEFAATLRANFTQLDTDRDNNLDAEEIAVVREPDPRDVRMPWPAGAPRGPMGETGEP